MRVFLLAGEASGDALGGALMAGLRQRLPGCAFHGIGGVQMQAAGLRSLFDMRELSVMGLAEVLPKYRQLKRRIAETAEAVLRLAPDLLVTIDSPDFCLRVARLVRARRPEQRIVHYVAPSVWAWRPGRAQKMRPLVDQVLALLPFEPPLMEAAGIACDFVGHPIVAEPPARPKDEAALRERLGLGDAPFVLALPGSRSSEVARLGAVFGQSLGALLSRRPQIQVVLPAAEGVAEEVRAICAQWPIKAHILAPGGTDGAEHAALKRAAFAGARVALAASGTVSLELAAHRTPMVIAYRFNWLTWQIMRRMALTDTVTLVNLVSGTRTVPEALGPRCRPEVIVPMLEAALDDPAAQCAAMDETMRLLGRGGPPPGQRAADAILHRHEGFLRAG